MSRLRLVFILTVLWIVLLLRFSTGHTQAAGEEIIVLDRAGKPVTRLTDGDTIRLRLVLPQNASQDTQVAFAFSTQSQPLAACTISSGSTSCDTEPFSTLGWYWDPGGIAAPVRSLSATLNGTPAATTAEVQVAARPVVMVHGLNSTYEAWKNYLGPTGYLASLGLSGFAVGDGQFPGVLNTGNASNPAGRTNTVAGNSAILGEYIASVKKATGAQQVDLLVHSMGGLISRYYIDRIMQERDVAQLIMLGTPQIGSPCADLPATLGFLVPASLEIRPSYMSEIFNPSITHRKGVPFYALAGTLIQKPVGSPCTPVPSDIAVSLDSASGIALPLEQVPMLHTDLNASPQPFEAFVRPHLETPAGEFKDEPDPPLPSQPADTLQFTRVYTGHVALGASQVLTIPVEGGVSVAKFALFDPTHSLTTTVQGASGNVIALDTVKNGLAVVDDPEVLFYMGYGFQDPKAGIWKITLNTTSSTPPSGADYALSANMQGGAHLQAEAAPLLPQIQETVHITAELQLDGQSLAVEKAQATIRDPAGNVDTINLAPTVGSSPSQRQAEWKPAAPGLYGVDVFLSGHTPQGLVVERTAFLSVEAQPVKSPEQAQSALTSIVVTVCAGLLLLAILVIGLPIWLIRRKRRATASL